MTSTGPKKVAILGGGAAAMTAAFELTNQPGWKDRYEVTVYQMGHRLGGKGASGRDRKNHDRIEEHGLHLWLGCYENAFRVMRQCYVELGRAPDQPLSTWDRAFTPWPLAGVMEQVGDEWLYWIGRFELNDEIPGQGVPFLSVWNLIGQGLGLLRDIFTTTPLGALPPRELAPLREALAQAARRSEESGGLRDRLGAALRAAMGTTRRDEIVPLLGAVTRALAEIAGPRLEESTVLRRAWIMTDLATAMLRGLILDDVVTQGFDVIDDYDLVEWLRRHGASELTVRSGFVRGIYDFAFGDHAAASSSGSMAAGAMTRLMMRMVLNYRGSMFYRMEGGMGDVVFAPLYEVLRRRGVRFEFFHAVKDLGLSPDGRAIDTIAIDRQVRLKGDRYRPLIDVKGLPCWPSEPLYEQIDRGDELEAGWIAKNYNLESHWSAWEPAERRTLKRGEDFDLVVLGVSLGSLPHLCSELIAARPAWKAMIDHLPTVKTQNLQLWLRPNLHGLGFPGDATVIDAFAQPFNTYADMAHLVPLESWPDRGPERPADIAYFCGPMPDLEAPPPADDHGYPAREKQRVRAEAERWLSENARVLWPSATTPANPRGLNWDLLVDPSRGRGIARLDAQYHRANIDPSDRYVRSPKGSTRYRLLPGESGFDNLFLAGDWTRNGINVGNVEAAVTSGMMAARAISGHPRRIAWVEDSGA